MIDYLIYKEKHGNSSAPSGKSLSRTSYRKYSNNSAETALRSIKKQPPELFSVDKWKRILSAENQFFCIKTKKKTSHLRYLLLFLRASCRIRTNDPEITNHVLWPAELKRQVGKLSTSRRYN